MRRSHAFVDLFLALALTVFGGLAGAALGQVLALRLGLPLVPILVVQGLLILGGLQALLAWRRLRWRDVGLCPIQSSDLLRGVLTLGFVLALNAAFALATERLAPELLETHQEGLSNVAGALTGELPLTVVAASMLFVGFYEEVLARGFLLTRCRTLIAGTWGPVLLSSLLFGLGHFYQGWLGVLQTALIGVVFARLALRWQTLWPLILAHAALNTLSVGILRAVDQPL